MTIDDLNILLNELHNNPGREHILKTAFALVEWFGLKLPKEGKERLLAPRLEKLKDYLIPHPLTKQYQYYRLTEKEQPITIRLGIIKKVRKDQLFQLIDKENPLCFQMAPPIIQGMASAPSYFVHLAATNDYDRIHLVLHKGDQKRIVCFRKKLTQTQFHKIVPQWQNIAAKSKPDIADLLWKSLDLKEVNKDFYKQIKERFDALLGIAKKQYAEVKENDIKQFAVRLIGRYIFCWFLKEKGIIPENLLASKTIEEHKNNFFQKYLQRLFFNTLNEEVQNRSAFENGIELESLYSNIPYLNGGLFEMHPEDNLFDKLDLNSWLISFVKVLENFDFTVDESSSRYQQVAIDPEMLGRIFENLLASQNPETEKLANQRKAYGAFYTPREIVDYMVNECLKAHLETALLTPLSQNDENLVVAEPMVAYSGTLFHAIEPQQTKMNFSGKQKAEMAEAERKRERLKEKIEKLFTSGCTDNPFDKDETAKVRKALSEVKALDPACGSGAFPMGVLLRLMELRQIVGHGHKNNYELKNEILSKNIFGVDIMPMAVEIARLRAWLSLVLEAEYKPTDSKNNFGIAALPNLDFKFVCANSLIDSGYDAFLENIHHNATLYRLDGEIQRLERLRENYYDPKGDKQEKENLEHEFRQTKEYIKTEFASLRKTWNLEDFLNKVDDWNPFDDSKPSSFFSPGWMFGIKDGFDVVIGNPPYVRQEDIKEYKPLLQKAGYQVYNSTSDLYTYFYELSCNILAPNRFSCFISSNKWMRAKYGEKLRNFFRTNTKVMNLIDFNGHKVFEATVDTNILLFQKGKPQKDYCLPYVNIDPDFTGEILDDYVRVKQQTIKQCELSDTGWTLADDKVLDLKKKIEKIGTQLKDWDVKIYMGIKTGFNEAFIIDNGTKERICKEDPKSDKILKPILRGRDIERYSYKWAGLWLIKIESRWTNENRDKENAEIFFKKKYPAIYKHLISFDKTKGKGKGLFNRDDQGDYWWELRDCDYYNDFENEKIAYPDIAERLSFAYEDGVVFTNNTVYFLNTGNKYLLAVLNSLLAGFYYRQISSQLGNEAIRAFTIFVEQLPIPKIPESGQQPFITRVEKILSLKKQNQSTAAIEKEIDVMVYKLYELTYNEVKIVDKDFRLSEQEYDAYEIGTNKKTN